MTDHFHRAVATDTEAIGDHDAEAIGFDVRNPFGRDLGRGYFGPEVAGKNVLLTVDQKARDLGQVQHG